MRRRLSAAFLLVFSVGCAREIPVGAVVSTTGAAAVHGEKVRKGLDLAVDEANAEAGFGSPRFRLVYRDDATRQEVAATAAVDLIEREGVTVIIGAVSSGGTLAIAPICEERRVLLVTPTASAPEISEAGDFVFRVFPSDTFEGRAMADFARDLGLTNVAVLSVGTRYGAELRHSFTRRFEAVGRTISLAVDFPAGHPSALAPLIGRMARTEVGGVYVIGDDGETAEILRLIRDAGLSGPVLATSWVTEAVARLAGTAAQGLVFPTHHFDPEADDPRTREFVARFEARYGEPPDTWSAHAYDALGVVVRAIGSAGSADAEAVRAILARGDLYRGVAGDTVFDEAGDVIRYPRLCVIRSGEVVPYERFVREGGLLPVPGRSRRTP